MTLEKMGAVLTEYAAPLGYSAVTTRLQYRVADT